MKHTNGRRRGVNGILLLDKPTGVTSNGALQQVKKIYSAQKAGHTGSLDLLASGMLPICFGEATKFSNFLLTADKQYWVSAKLGIKTETGDAEGKITKTCPVVGLTRQKLLGVLDKFRGVISQIPSMYSAIKYQGKPLYRLARQGIEVPRNPREVHIFDMELLDFAGDEFSVSIHCSKGTYVRTLIEDIGEVLGCGAHVTGLRRTQVGPYLENEMITVEALMEKAKVGDFLGLDKLLLSIDSTVSHCPSLVLTQNTAYYLKQGQAVMVPQAPSSGLVRLFSENTHFIGIGEVLEDGRIAPRRLMVESS